MDEIVDDMEPKPSGSRRTWTMRNNAARQVAVNFMPSRQLPYNTLRPRRTNTERSALLEDCRDGDDGDDSSDQQANIIVREMELHQQLMEDNLQAEELRREALRDLPEGLTIKRTVRAKLSASVSLRSKRKPISVFRRFKYRLSFALTRLKRRIRNVAFSIELWYEAIRAVEGHLGSAVASYFYFLRWLFLLNVSLTILVLGFVVTPQLLYDAANMTVTSERSTGPLDFFSGKGVFEDTVLFYGHYASQSTNTSANPFNYNISYAYFYTMFSLFAFVFIILSYRTAYSYRANFISAAGAGAGPGLGAGAGAGAGAARVLAGWDHGVSSPRAVQLAHRALYNEFKELLSEQMKIHEPISLCLKFGHYATNIVSGIVVFASIMSLEYGFWYILSVRVDAMDSLRASEYWALLVTFVVTLVLAISPTVFSLVARLEFYSPRTTLYVTLCRTFLLDLSTLLLLLLFWSKSNVDCWETALGQETYRLVLFDAFFSLILLPIIEFVRGYIYKVYNKWLSPQFDLASNSLTLIYNQAVLWLGLAFSPLLVLIVTLKFFLIFYVKRECALRFCQPAAKVWRAAQTQTVMFMLVNLSLFITLFALGSLFFRTSSHKCGPFQSYQFIYSVVSEGLLGLSGRPMLRNCLVFITRPGVIAGLFLLLCVWVYYMRAKSLAQQSMVRMLRQMLILEAKDKDFLLGAIEKVSNGEWQYMPKEDDGTEVNETHTWKYLNNSNVRKPSNAGFHFDVSRLNHSILDNTRPRSYASAKENRPNSLFQDRPKSYNNPNESKEDGDTDSSFSWQGSGYLNDEANGMNEVQVERGDKKWI